MKIEKGNFSVCDRGDSEEKLRVTSPEDALQLSYRILVGIKASKLIGFFTVNSQNIRKNYHNVYKVLNFIQWKWKYWLKEVSIGIQLVSDTDEHSSHNHFQISEFHKRKTKNKLK